MSGHTMQEEAERLAACLRDIEMQLNAFGPRYTGDDFTEQMLDLEREGQRLILEKASREPYFGRIDFQELSKDEAKPLYIGKAGVSKQGSTELLVIDWRAPVASLFYSFTGGDAPASYESPDGEISGYMHLKRNFVIRQRELVRLVDSYVRGQEEESVTDEFLLYRLGENKDNKLRDIVSTIQGEQDRIIRAERNKALFIQGVAGSGKTTVALHRLAFLLYQYSERMRAERMIIFAPNRMFLDYISGVLPELGVGNIGQTTFNEWALAQLEHEVTLASAAEDLEHWFERQHTVEEIAGASGRFKGSLKFKALIDEQLLKFESKIVPAASFIPIEGLELAPEQMREWYETDYGKESLMRKRERLANRIKRWLESELKMRNVTDKGARTKALTKYNSFVKKIPSYTAVQLYASLFQGKQTAIPKPIAQATAERLKANKASSEDMAALVYIQLQLHGLNSPPFDHIVIDEAQDYSPFQLEVLRQCQITVSMTVLGDLQQGIHAYTGIQHWSELSGLFDAEQQGYFELNRSYRSTMEIIEYANRLLRGMSNGVKPAVPVFRSGDPVEEIAASGEGWLEAISAAVQEWQRSGQLDTIAVIGRTAEQCEAIFRYLQGKGFDVSLVESRQPSYGGGLSVVPVYLSKGLEFDAVLIADAGESEYGPLDAKLLYVGCTRALHKLKLFYRGELTGLLQEPAAD